MSHYQLVRLRRQIKALGAEAASQLTVGGIVVAGPPPFRLMNVQDVILLREVISPPGHPCFLLITL